jgi:hypothetical protein
MTKAEQDLLIAVADAVAELAYNWPDRGRLHAAIIAKKDELVKDDPAAVVDIPIDVLEKLR